MKKVYQEELVLKQNILYPFTVHIQKGFGKRIMTNAHWHYYVELLYCISGAAKVFISGHSYKFAVGDMVLINSREVHSIIGDSDDAIKYIVLKIDPHILYSISTTVFESKYVLPFTLIKSAHQKVFTNNEIKHTHVPKLLNDILEESKAKTFGYELAIRNNIGSIFLWILRNWHEKGFDFSAGSNLSENAIKNLQFVFEYVDKHYMENVSVETVARELNMSYSYFSRFFKASVGTTFSSYLNYVRITEAEKLLMSTDLTITEIAMETGFSSTSYFIDRFKQYKALTPKQFKKKFLVVNE